MSIRVKCSGCGKTIKGGDDWSGKSANCPHCSTVVRFPRSATGIVSETEYPPEVPPTFLNPKPLPPAPVHAAPGIVPASPSTAATSSSTNDRTDQSVHSDPNVTVTPREWYYVRGWDKLWVRILVYVFGFLFVLQLSGMIIGTVWSGTILAWLFFGYIFYGFASLLGLVRPRDNRWKRYAIFMACCSIFPALDWWSRSLSSRHTSSATSHPVPTVSNERKSFANAQPQVADEKSFSNKQTQVLGTTSEAGNDEKTSDNELTQVFDTTGHKNARGIGMRISYPDTWKPIEIEDAEMLQAFASDAGRGKLGMLIQVLPFRELTENEKRSLFTREAMQKDMDDHNAKVQILTHEFTKIDGETCAMIETEGPKSGMTSLGFLIPRKVSKLMIWFLVSDDAADGLDEYDVAKQLFLKIIKSCKFTDRDIRATSNSAPIKTTSKNSVGEKTEQKSQANLSSKADDEAFVTVELAHEISPKEPRWKQLIQAYGFVLGQQATLELIDRKFPELGQGVKESWFAFKSSALGESVEGVEAELSGELEDKWPEMKEEFSSQVKELIEKQQITKDQAIAFLAEVKQRGKGELPDAIRAALLSAHPRFLPNPGLELEEGWKQTFRSKGHQKAKGADFSVSFPASWSKREGDRPNIIQFFQSGAGHGPVMCSLMVKGIPLPAGYVPTAEEVKEFFQPNELKGMIPEGATFIDAKSIVLDGSPAGMLVCDQTMQRLDKSITMRMTQFSTIQGTSMVLIQFMVVKTPTESLDELQKKYLPTYRSIANTLVLNDQYNPPNRKQPRLRKSHPDIPHTKSI